MNGCTIIQLCNTFGCNPVTAGFIDSPLMKLRHHAYSEAMKNSNLEKKLNSIIDLENKLQATKVANAVILYPL